jgi:glycosyltransferase involved in cell wall biosynthesis
VAGWLRRFHRRAGCTLVPTAQLAEALAARGYERLRIVGRGVDSDTFSPARRSAALRATWGADDTTPVVLLVSRLAPEKNIPLALEAFAAMHALRPQARLVLVGDGPMLASLQGMLGAGRGPILAGRKENGALAAHYASADIFLFPSLTETFGNVVIEAMASGLAVVAYDYAAARRYIRHGYSGLLAARGDAASFIRHAMDLVRDLPRAKALGCAARTTAAALGWEAAVGDFERVLEETHRQTAVRQAAHAAT